jgi:hypothetical protein
MRKLLAFCNPSNGVNVRHYLAKFFLLMQTDVRLLIAGLHQLVHKLPRFTGLVLFTLALLAFIAYLKPELIGDDIHKLSLATLGALLGFWLDLRALPYARPDGYLVAADWRTCGKREDAADFAIVSGYELVFAIACFRRIFIMGLTAFVIGMAM